MYWLSVCRWCGGLMKHYVKRFRMILYLYKSVILHVVRVWSRMSAHYIYLNTWMNKKGNHIVTSALAIKCFVYAAGHYVYERDHGFTNVLATAGRRWSACGAGPFTDTGVRCANYRMHPDTSQVTLYWFWFPRGVNWEKKNNLRVCEEEGLQDIMCVQLQITCHNSMY